MPLLLFTATDLQPLLSFCTVLWSGKAEKLWLKSTILSKVHLPLKLLTLTETFCQPKSTYRGNSSLNLFQILSLLLFYYQSFYFALVFLFFRFLAAALTDYPFYTTTDHSQQNHTKQFLVCHSLHIFITHTLNSAYNKKSYT